MVGEVEFILLIFPVVTFDGEIAALINHWHGRLHGGTIVDTFLRLIGMVNDVLDILLAMAEQPHEIGRSAEG